ncbi:MAG: helix-turn-helix domain-containing protein [Solirubrobacterales bacterium]
MFQGIYRSADRPKRHQEVLERLEWGTSVERIARDLGITRASVRQVVERLREDGSLPPDFRPVDAG